MRSSTPTPPLSRPAVGADSIYHRSGTYGVAAICLAIVLNNVVRKIAAPFSPSLASAIGFIAMGVFVVAIGFGLFALGGIRRHGSGRLLWKGMVAGVIPGLLIVLAVSAAKMPVRKKELGTAPRAVVR